MTHLPWTLRVTLPALLLTAPLGAQARLGAVLGGPGDDLGWALANAGDLDGDGFDDLLISAPRSNQAGGAFARGSVQCISGASLPDSVPDVVLQSLVGPATPRCSVFSAFGPGFGLSVAGGGDIDGDGSPDFAVGAPQNSTVIVYDGLTGGALLAPPNNLNRGCGMRQGAAMRFIDVDGDAHADLLVTRTSESTTNNIGRFDLYNGAWLDDPSSGAPKTHYSGASTIQFDFFGSSAAVIGDLDGDQIDDFAIGAPVGGTGSQPGWVQVRSGATGAVLGTIPGLVGADRFGDCLAPVGDRDGDGIADLAVGAPGWRPGANGTRIGRVEIVSGAWIGGAPVARTLVEFIGPDGPGDSGFGDALESVDANRDPYMDLVVTGKSQGQPAWRLVSGRSGQVLWTVDAPASDTTVGLSIAVLETPAETRLALGASSSSVAGSDAGLVLIVQAHDGAPVGGFNSDGTCACGADPMAGCVNETGSGALLGIESGSVSLQAQHLEFLASGLPPNVFCLLLAGPPAQQSIPIFSGTLAIAGAQRSSVILLSDAAGQVVAAGNTLGTFPPGTAIAGRPLAVQLFYRDNGCGAAPGSANLSNSLIIQPRP